MKSMCFYFTAAVCALFIFFNEANAQQISLKKIWETPAEFKEPESVLIDEENKVIYVSNINDPAGGKDGNGSIGRLNLKGEVMEVEWVIGGMDAPKGLGLHQGLLYAADLTQVAVIDVAQGKLVKTIPVQGAGMLNDITVDEQGKIFVSDTEGKKIFLIQDGKAEEWLASPDFKAPNGLLAHQNKLFMVDMGSGLFYEINKGDKSLNVRAQGLQGGDGIAAHQDGFIISNWNGEIWKVGPQGDVQVLLDTKADKVNAADIAYSPALNLLLVPTFFANTVAAYEIVK